MARLDSLDNTRNTTTSKALHHRKRTSYVPPNDVSRTANKMFGQNAPTSSLFVSPLLSPAGPTSPTLMSPANTRDFRRTVANQSVQNRARLDPGSITTFNMKEVFKHQEGSIDADASKLQLRDQLSNLSNYERILQIHQNLKTSKQAWAQRSPVTE